MSPNDRVLPLLEPIVADLGSVCTSLGEAATISAAISLKRIADALPDGGGIHGFVMDLAYQAGTNFEAGKRRA